MICSHPLYNHSYTENVLSLNKNCVLRVFLSVTGFYLAAQGVRDQSQGIEYLLSVQIAKKKTRLAYF